MLHLSNLNESFNKIYESNDTSLTEAFGKGIPNWVQSRLSDLNKYHGTEKSGPYYTNRNAIPWDKLPDYSQPRGFYGRDRELSLFQNLLNGVDLDQLQIIDDGDIPTKRTDPRLKAPNIPVWGFPNGQVYIPGYNDNEIDNGSTYIGPKGSKMAFKYTPTKYFLENASHFAYIDGSSLPTSTYGAKRTIRKETAKELKDMGYGRQDKDPKQFVKEVPYQGGTPDNQKKYLDKSGYIADPGKYIKKLEDKRADQWSEQLDKRREEILDLRDDIVAAMNYYDPFEDPAKFSRLGDISDDLRRAIDNFNSASKEIQNYADEIAKDPNGGYCDMYKRMLREKVKNLMSDTWFQRVVDRGNDMFLGSADWLV